MIISDMKTIAKSTHKFTIIIGDIKSHINYTQALNICQGCGL